MHKFGESRIIALSAGFFASFVLTTANYYRLAMQLPEQAVQAAAERSDLRISAGESQGTIYDRNMIPLTNSKKRYIAVIVPSGVNMEEGAATAVEPEEFRCSYEKGRPFAYECLEGTKETDTLTVFCIPERYSSPQPAQHIIGYVSGNTGISGIEYAYDAILRGSSSENSVTYSVDGSSQVMLGKGKTVIRSRKSDTGVVLTIDSRIQALCENAAAV